MPLPVGMKNFEWSDKFNAYITAQFEGCFPEIYPCLGYDAIVTSTLDLLRPSAHAWLFYSVTEHSTNSSCSGGSRIYKGGA